MKDKLYEGTASTFDGAVQMAMLERWRDGNETNAVVFNYEIETVTVKDLWNDPVPHKRYKVWLKDV